MRELQNLVRRLAVLQSDETIGAAMVEQELAGPARPGEPDTDGSAARPDHHRAFSIATSRGYFADFGDGLPPDGLYDRVLREVEIPLITAALAATDGNQLRAADLLGINRNTLRSKIRSYGLKVHPRPNLCPRDVAILPQWC